LAEAGVAYALAWQRDADAQKQWPPNGDTHEWAFAGGRLRIEVTNAGGLINLNTADAELLKALLKAAGAEISEQDRIVEAILDWRGNRRDQEAPRGTESTVSSSQSAAFESLDELGQISAITKQLQERLAQVATVYSYHYGVSPELAPVQVLQALGLDERIITDYMQARARAAAEGSSPPPFPQSNNPSFFSQSRSNVYHIAVVAETASGTAVIVKAVFDTQSGTTGRSLRLLSWREGR
jgi:general secretion pathway protein K